MKHNIDTKLIAKVTHEEIMRYLAMPYRIKDGVLSILTAEPKDRGTSLFFRRRFEVDTINEIVITNLDLTRVSEELYRYRILDTSIHGLFYRNPDESAQRVLTRPQIVLFILFFCVSAFWIYYSSTSFFILLLLLIQIFYVVTVTFRVIVSIYGLGRKLITPITTKELNAIDQKDLPVYTILLPVYKDAGVMGTLIKALKKFDYPKDKLDIILLLEEGDEETIEAAKRERPPANWRFISMPDSLLKTKPKALNYGLHFARGDYHNIYDAEDISDPDQLKKAVISF
ncbi:hypothetical protein C5S53_01985 [Methanophagales archaeon]|nr:hypothetical protein C5S53_01985 [Methanophagales archaeon]